MTTTWYQKVTETQNPKNSHAIRVTEMILLQNFLTNTPPYSIYTEYAPYTLETYHVFLLADDNTLYNLTDGFTLTPHESGHLCQLKEQYRRDLHTLTEGRDATIQALLMVCEYV